MNKNIDFTDYNRMTDVLMYLTDIITLNFTVSLYSKSKTGERRFFQYEAEYKTGDVYNSTTRTVKRNMNFYFTIDNKEQFTAGMILRPQDVEVLIRLIDTKVLPWFFGDDKVNAFQIVKNQLVLKEFEPVYYTQSYSKWIKFEPIAYSFEDGSFSQGIQMSLAGGDIIPIILDKFLGFYHLLHTDMYAAACNMVTYLKVPPYGINEFKTAGLGTGRPKEDWAPPKELEKRGNSFLENAKKKE